jgi:murein DD-endopeptidase MepM/ murein hydrolase activator NlpD
MKNVNFIRSIQFIKLTLLGILLLPVLAFADVIYANLARTPLVYPLVGTRISSSYGKRVHPVLKSHRHHAGIDLAAPEDAPIRSIKSGTVVFADQHGGYGNLIVVAHTDGLTSHYGHCKKIIVKPGQKVKAGQLIGSVGSTGMVTGPHLHFEVRLHGKSLDPHKLFPAIGSKGQG